MQGILSHARLAPFALALPSFLPLTLPDAPLSVLFLSFILYGFVGWLYESTVCAISIYGRFSNSGFLLGPCCPIYGVGALACWVLLRGIPNVAVQFLAAAVVCCCIEYVVGAVLERLTGARFWDYTEFPFNINGRVCLYGALLFGVGAVVVCRLIQPAVLLGFGMLPRSVLLTAAGVSAIVLALDAVSSIASWRRLSDQLEEIRGEMSSWIDDSLREASDNLILKLPDAALDTASSAMVRGRVVNAWLAELSDTMLETVRVKAGVPSFISDGAGGLRLAAKRLVGAIPLPSLPVHVLRRRDLRFFDAFPRLRMPSYEGVIRATKLKDRARELFNR